MNTIDCPALHLHSADYPLWFQNRTPKKVRVLYDVESELYHYTCDPNDVLQANRGEEFPVWVNSHGAVAIVFPDGRKLGVKPGEFEVIEWHE